MRRALRGSMLGVSLLIAVAVIWWSVDRGRALQRAQPAVFLGAAPLVGRNARDGWDWRFGWGLVGAVAIGLVVAAATWRGWWWSLRQRWVIAGSAVAAMAFAVALALTDGADGVLYGARDKTEYLANLRHAPPAGEFVRTFVDRINYYTVHVRGHPPGFVLVLKAMQAIGLRGAWPVASLSVLAVGMLVVAVLVTVRAVAGEVWMRRCAPALIVAPYAVWMVTSADAVYTAVGATGIALVAVGVRRTSGQAALLGLAGGVLLGSLLFLTYLGVVLLVVPAAVLVAGLMRRTRPAWATAGGCVVGVLAVVAAWRVAGFWWVDGAFATRRAYRAGSAQFRTWSYFEIGNIGAALFAIGPLTVLGVAALRDRTMRTLVGGGLLALVISHLSQLTKAEVERIWLLFYPWLAIAAATLIVHHRRRWAAGAIALQASCAIVLQSALVSKW